MGTTNLDNVTPLMQLVDHVKLMLTTPNGLPLCSCNNRNELKSTCWYCTAKILIERMDCYVTGSVIAYWDKRFNEIIDELETTKMSLKSALERQGE